MSLKIRCLGVALVDSLNNTVDAVDRRTPLITYMRDPSVKTDMVILRMTFKYVLIDDELYR
jgi:hypothetical protein